VEWWATFKFEISFLVFQNIAACSHAQLIQFAPADFGARRSHDQGKLQISPPSVARVPIASIRHQVGKSRST
jgi:hypothetical protein